MAPAYYFLFILFPIVPFALAFLGTKIAIVPICGQLPFHPQFRPTEQINAGHISTMNFWISALTFLYFVGGAALILLIRMLILTTRSAGKPGLYLRIEATIASLVFSLLLLFCLRALLKFCWFDMPIAAFSNVLLHESGPSESIASARLLDWMYQLYASNKVFSIIVTVMFVASIAALLLPINDTEPEELRERLNRLNHIALAGAIALTASVYESAAFMDVGGEFFLNEFPNYKSLVKGHQALWGSVWSLVLLAAYVPALICLRGRIQHLAKKAVAGASYQAQAKWMETNGLQVDLLRQLRSVVAMFGPLLVTPASQLFGA
jgi:hypothetical protein